MMGKLVSISKAKTLLSKGAILIDVRNPVDFRDGTIKGAINLVVENISQLMRYPKTTKFIFFGKNKEDINLTMMLKYASQMFNDVYFIDDMDKWK